MTFSTPLLLYLYFYGDTADVVKVIASWGVIETGKALLASCF